MSYCKIAPGHPFHGPYHDREYGFPIRRESALFERLALEINQAGLSWLTMLQKREGFRRAFAGFDPGDGRAVRAARAAQAPARRGHHPQPAQDRRRHREREAHPEAARDARLLREVARRAPSALARRSGRGSSRRRSSSPAERSWARSWRAPATCAARTSRAARCTGRWRRRSRRGCEATEGRPSRPPRRDGRGQVPHLPQRPELLDLVLDDLLVAHDDDRGLVVLEVLLRHLLHLLPASWRRRGRT